ncbi:Endonuclease/exonuclease/phosphatase [Arabidopsis suecica]|uniref:Endonuclease/exonuclease/phosphatase n=1 Tax=Arabidopsis suecica TaxID=45249 RepID=A0A8T1XD86_ARASU|nr:Endonuclease/exonuclease/phosphatase [Arabidopsis suecica]
MLNLIAFLRRRLRRPRKARISVNHHRSGDTSPETHQSGTNGFPSAAAIHPNPEKTITVATFNAAMFSMAPAVPNNKGLPFRSKSAVDRPKSILKPMNAAATPTHDERFAKSRPRVSINLPDNEISRQLSFREDPQHSPLRPALSFSGEVGLRSTRTALEVLRELDADVLALQDVKADEADQMRPLSDLAAALGMNYIFAESWAPEYGNAILSKWPIKSSDVLRIFDDTDFRNVLKASIEVPGSGEVEFHCTHLDHLDEKWRMKQVDAIIRSTNVPHILAGALNSLDESDYSPERWTDIVKYYEEMGKPIPKAQVMRFLKSKEYTDAKDFAGECESVVVVAKGQSVQGTCKYGTRVDYILASSDSPYRFVPGSYSVLSSKGTSDHHIVKVDVVKARAINVDEQLPIRHKLQRVTATTYNNNSSLTKASWRTHYYKA